MLYEVITVKVTSVTETTRFHTGKELWDWIVYSNPIVEMVLTSLNLTVITSYSIHYTKLYDPVMLMNTATARPCSASGTDAGSGLEL